jgi:hypothetical protein
MVDNFRSNFGSFIDELNNITKKGNYQVTPELKPVSPQTINMTSPSLPGGYSSSSSSGGGGSELDRLMNAIRSQESGGDYDVVNTDSGAAGAYQIMPFNWTGSGGWDVEALGHDVGYNEFINNPQIQDAIARYKLNQYLQDYGAAGAAVAWYGGPGAVNSMHDNAPQPGGYPSLYAYWTSVLNQM